MVPERPEPGRIEQDEAGPDHADSIDDAGKRRRRAAIASADGSLRAENLVASAESDRDAELWIDGRITADEAVRRAIRRHHRGGPASAGKP
ncbi:hypothetical protein [Embleya sp. NBC_00888]|uniref:antitoxin VbhA family protein n=1 Tax=Embleya sp. NBC_00888 TaxID=2975960 RepID=UPI003868F116